MNFLKKLNFISSIRDKIKKESKENEQEFVFIWYKKMEVGNKTQYTSTNRTKIKANNREEAVKKMTDFAMRKMVLVIHEEKDYSASDLGQLNAEFDKINEHMDKIFNSFNKTKKEKWQQ